MKILIWGRHAVLEAKKYGKILQITENALQAEKIVGKGIQHQNMVAMIDYPLYSIDAFFKEEKILLLDGITDTRNLGAIIRSAAVLGWRNIILSKKEKAFLNGTVAHVASGGIHHVRIAIDNISTSIAQLKKYHFNVIALDEKGSTTQPNYDKLALVIGDEHSGVQCKKQCDYIWSIANKDFCTLNASVAASIAMHAFSY